jgi:hypothetical protein
MFLGSQALARPDIKDVNGAGPVLEVR